ncbi:MAG: DNA recombination protein RmuC [Candidatus Doudnabacteria bacterium]|nr:DNA recombination protein RmuC [Candidatus Doudnabacteria bacterium]
MTTFLYAIIVIFVLGFGALLYFLLDLKRKSESTDDTQALKVMMEWMKEMKQSTEQTREGMQRSIDETNKAINERLDNAARVIGSLSKELGGISQIGPDIRRLSETLASPKMRGNFGEEMLENMLSQIMPKDSYKIQYRFKNGETVDACIFIGSTILSIDSKFSLENFRLFKEANTEESQETLRKAFLKDVKKRVDEICKKYILPQEGTFDFALMYVPSEGIYQEVIEADDIIEYCRAKAVIPVSPNTMYIYLRNIMLSLRGQEINKKAQEILKMISGIKTESDKFSKNLDILGTHIKNAGNTMGTVTTDFTRLKSNIQNAANLELDSTDTVPEPTKLIE